jgi:mannose-6-phosphate isomerase
MAAQGGLRLGPDGVEARPGGNVPAGGARWTLPANMAVVDKPWGREIWWAVTDHYLGKILELRAGHAHSLQYHERKMETMYVQSGRARFHVDGRVFEPSPGSAVTLPPGTVHRVEAIDDVVLIEVSTPHPDDVVRLEDRYGRAPADPAPGARKGTGSP